jgi:hypothetical protein
MDYNDDEWKEEKEWEREFRKEREKHFRQFMGPWYEADDEEGGRIIIQWANREQNANWLVYTVLEQKFFKAAVEYCQGDEPTAAEAFEQTFEELRQEFSGDRLSYQCKNAFVALFSHRLEWRCVQRLRPKQDPLSHILIPGKSTWGEILGWLIEEEDETTVEETIAADTPFTETYGGWSGPQEYMGGKETQEERAEQLKGFLQGLSPALVETWRVMLQIAEEATGEITKHELFRRTREILNIEPSTLTDRVHQTKLVWGKWFRNPPPNKRRPKKKR